VCSSDLSETNCVFSICERQQQQEQQGQQQQQRESGAREQIRRRL